MHRQTQSTCNFGRKRLGFIALVLCVCFILVTLGSAVFIGTHASHIHDHDGPGGSCVMCAHITSAENLLKQLAAIAAILVAAALCHLAHRYTALIYSIISGLFSPVALKVKLNN